jgi:hypothetical protein
MSRSTATRTATLSVAALGACLALAVPVSAQGGPGFLFGHPNVSIGFKGGYAMPRASGDVFNDLIGTDTLFTLDRDDFRGVSFGGEIAVRLTERWDVALGVAYAARRIQSEYVLYFDQDENPIEQETSFRTVPVTVSGKYYLTDRGRSIGRFAWVPARLAPFVTGGVGIVAYRFEQTGDFIDFRDPEFMPIVFDRLTISGTAPYVHAGAGVDLSLSKSFVLTGEARYGWASGDPSRDFQGGYDNLDLAGLQLQAGIAARF